MARRVGAGALIAAFPGLTSSGVELAFDYARRHRAVLEKKIECQGEASAASGSDEGTDDAAKFEADLDQLLDKNAEVFRRLAQ
jgi:hypothetical protein